MPRRHPDPRSPACRTSQPPTPGPRGSSLASDDPRPHDAWNREGREIGRRCGRPMASPRPFPGPQAPAGPRRNPARLATRAASFPMRPAGAGFSDDSSLRVPGPSLLPWVRSTTSLEASRNNRRCWGRAACPPGASPGSHHTGRPLGSKADVLALDSPSRNDDRTRRALGADLVGTAGSLQGGPYRVTLMNEPNKIPYRRRFDAASAVMALVTVAALVGAAWLRDGWPRAPRPLAVGDLAPPLHLLDLESTEPLVLVGSRGKVVWITFWSADSADLRSSLKTLHEALGPLKPHTRFALITAAVEAEQPDRVRRAVADTGVDLPVYLASAETRRLFGAVQADPPVHVLIDAEGHVSAIARGAGEQTIKRIAEEAKRELDEIDPLGQSRFAGEQSQGFRVIARRMAATRARLFTRCFRCTAPVKTSRRLARGSARPPVDPRADVVRGPDRGGT